MAYLVWTAKVTASQSAMGMIVRETTVADENTSLSRPK